jgi:hypothetical protein
LDQGLAPKENGLSATRLIRDRFFPIAALAGTFPLRLEQIGAGRARRESLLFHRIGMCFRACPGKACLGLDPMGGNRFSEKDMRSLKNLEHMPIQTNRHVLQTHATLITASD